MFAPRFDADTIRAVATVVAFNLFVGGILLCRSIPFHLRFAIDNLTQCGGPFIAFLWCLNTIRIEVLKRIHGDSKDYKVLLPAICFSLGALAFSIGQAIWSYYELKLNIAAPFPSWADAAFLGAYPFLFLGVFTLPSQPTNLNKRTVLLFEGLMLMSGIACFSWFFVLGPTVLQAGETLQARIIGSAYPLFDVGMICCVLLAFVRSGRVRLSRVGVVIAVGLMSIVGIDSVFDFLTLHGTYHTGGVIDLGWTFGYMMIVVAGYSAIKPDISADEAKELESAPHRLSLNLSEATTLTEWRPLLVQYFIVFGVGALLWQSMHPGYDYRLRSGVCIGAAIVVVLLLVRQFFMILENRDLTKKLFAFGENLEDVVNTRTKELAVKTDQLLALQALTTAINETLDEDKVLNAAVEQARVAFDAEAVAIWLHEAGEVSDRLAPHACVGMPGTSDPIRRAAECQLSDTCLSQTIVAVSGHQQITFEYLQAPLRSRGIVLGKIGVLRCLVDYTQEEIKLLDSMTLHVSTAYDNAKQFWNARDAADRDPVTGLLNHRAIHEYLDTAIELESAFEEPLAVILADIDNFHLFNDTYGHPVGDDVLRKIGKILDSTLVAPCKVGRYRGDEFIIVLPGLDSGLAISLAQRLQFLISELDLKYGEDDRSIPSSMSFGVAAFPKDSTDRQDLLITANSNLRTAKNSEDHIVALSDLQRAHRELRVSSSFRMLDGMVTAVDNKDSYTRRHSEDVTDFALWIADEFGLDDETKQTLRAGGLLHDVGKIGVPDEILHKPGRLTDEEYAIMKQHPTLGALIVGGVSGMENILDIVKHHHEQWDGSGYPDALAGEDIPFNARLVAVADAMSAMTTDRPYRKGLSMDVALNRVREGMGTQFDPEIAAAFLRVAESRFAKPSHDELTDTELPKAA